MKKRGLVGYYYHPKEITDLEKYVSDIYFGLEFYSKNDFTDSLKREFYSSLDGFMKYTDSLIRSTHISPSISLIFGEVLFDDLRGKSDEYIKLRLYLLNKELQNLEELSNTKIKEIQTLFIDLQESIYRYYSQIEEWNNPSNRRYVR